MRHLVTAVFALSLSQAATADQRGEYDAALAKWKDESIQSYTFTYRWNGAAVLAPACADATIRVRVKNGISDSPTVIRGNSRCPRGTRGLKAIGFFVPATIDEVFVEMFRYISNPPIQVRVTVSYDETFGVPESYFVEKIEIADNDEGFKITSFEVTK